MKPDEINPEQQKPQEVNETFAEEHVVELMGPPQRLDGSKPPEAEKPVHPTPVTPPEPVKSAPEVDINEINKELQAQVEGEESLPEADIDMNEPPAEFDSSGQGSDATLDKAVEDIMRTDADKALPPEADGVNLPPVVMKASFFERIKQAYFKWWDHRVLRYSTLGVLTALIAVVVIVTPVRNAVLNALGVRTSVSVTAIDGSTTLPLKNVILSAGTVQTKTNSKGYAKLQGIKLGEQEVKLHKAGFKDVKKMMQLGMRTTDLGEVSLKAVGTQYTFVLTDYFSAKPLKDVNIVSGEATTVSDKTGTAILTVAPSDDINVSVEIEKQGYRTEKIEVAAEATKPTALKLVPAPKEVFISKESGKYDLYKMDLDGQNKKVLLAGTGLETPAVQVIISPDGKRAAMVSTRDDKRNKDGYLLSALTIIDVDSGDTEVIEHAEQITLLGWSGTMLVYQQTVAEASAANANRNKITSYEYTDSKRIQVANANYFNGAILSGNTVYYVVSSIDPSVIGGFMRTNVDGTNKKTLHEGEVWQLYRSDYKTLKFQTPDKWYDYKIGGTTVVVANPPANYSPRKYLDSSDGKLSVWVDDRDANGALMEYSVADGKERQVTVQKGMIEVMRWVNERVVIYRTMNGSQIDEHAISLDGGEPKQLATVSAMYR